MHLLLKTFPTDILLFSILERIVQVCKSILELKFYHVLRDNSVQADKCTNQASLLKMGELLVYGSLRYQTIHSN
jgi:hypothetical protein